MAFIVTPDENLDFLLLGEGKIVEEGGMQADK
jgi:hypothetical protein